MSIVDDDYIPNDEPTEYDVTTRAGKSPKARAALKRTARMASAHGRPHAGLSKQLQSLGNRADANLRHFSWEEGE